jgi:integrase
MRLKVRPEATKVASAERWAPLDDRGVAILAFLRLDPAGHQYPLGDFIFGQFGKPPVEITDRFKTALLKAFPSTETATIEWVKGVHGPAARQRLDEIDVLFGDLRHEGALRKYETGNWSLNKLQVLLGHSNLVQTSTYLGVGNLEVQQAMEQHGSGINLGDGPEAKVMGRGEPMQSAQAIRGNPSRNSADGEEGKKPISH